MATKIIKAWIDGAVQEIEVEDIVSPEMEPSVEERVDKLEDKHEVVFADGNFLVGNGTEELEEMTPEEVLSHINGASVATMTTAEFEALEESNANTLYLLTDSEDEGSTSGGTSSGVTDVVRYDTEQTLTTGQMSLARNNIGAVGFDDVYTTKETTISFTWDGVVGERDVFEYRGNVYCKVSDSIPEYTSIGSIISTTSDDQIETINYPITYGWNCYSVGSGIVIERTANCSFDGSNYITAPSTGIYFMSGNGDGTGLYQKSLEISIFKTITLRYVWDGDINGKDTFVYSEGKNYYKISDDFLDFNAICNSILKHNNGDYSHTNDDTILLKGMNCYIIDNDAIVVTQAGECNLPFSSLPLNYRESDVSFTAPSTGIYFMHYTDADYYTEELELFINNRNGIYLNSASNNFIVGVTNDGAITTEDNNGAIVEMAKKSYVDEQIAAIGNIDVETDTTLTISGKAADAKVTGNAIDNLETDITNLNTLVGDSPVSEQIEQAIEEAITEVYVQNDEPTEALEGSIWIDTDADGAPTTSGKTSANVYVVDARTADMTTVDFSQYKIGDVVLVTTS